jgi:hypothetical protein
MKRRVLLINPKFQLQFMAWSASTTVIAVLVMHAAHLWFFRNLRNLALQSGLPENHVFFQFIRDRQSELNLITLVTFVGLTILLSVFGLFFSHQIAGPMYRLRKHFEEVGRTGKHTPLKFREGDFFQEIPEAYNLQFKSTET